MFEEAHPCNMRSRPEAGPNQRDLSREAGPCEAHYEARARLAFRHRMAQARPPPCPAESAIMGPTVHSTPTTMGCPLRTFSCFGLSYT